MKVWERERQRENSVQLISVSAADQNLVFIRKAISIQKKQTKKKNSETPMLLGLFSGQLQELTGGHRWVESQDLKGNVNFKNNNKDITLQTSKI